MAAMSAGAFAVDCMYHPLIGVTTPGHETMGFVDGGGGKAATSCAMAAATTDSESTRMMAWFIQEPSLRERFLVLGSLRSQAAFDAEDVVSLYAIRVTHSTLYPHLLYTTRP
jgi:hypothetical protein